MNRETLVLPAVAGLLASAVVGCGGHDSGPHGGTVVVGSTDRIEATGSAPGPLDPAQASDPGARSVLHNTFQTLMRLPASGTDPVPDAAERCAFTDRHGEQYRCTLRRGLTFADGTPLTAADVKYSLDRVARIQDAGGPASLLGGVDRVETPGSRQVVIDLTAPDATFPSKLTTPATSIVEHRAYPKDAPRRGFSPVGSGPYTVHAEVRDHRLSTAVFTPNPRYRGADRPRNSRVEMRFFPDSDALARALASGQVDLAGRTLSPEQIERLQAGRVRGVHLLESAGAAIGCLAFDTGTRPVSSRAVRRALAQVVDREALVRDVYHRTVQPLYSLVPTGVLGHVNSFHDAYGDPDVGAARRVLRAAGVHPPVKLTLTYPTDHYGPATGEEFAELRRQLDASGLFSVRTTGVAWSHFRQSVRRGAYPAYGVDWTPEFPDPDDYVAPFLARDDVLGSPYRSRPIQETLIPRTRQRTDRAMSVGDFRRVQDIAADDVPVLPLWQSTQYVAASDDVVGAEYAFDPSATLQLWELGSGGGG